MGKEKEQGFDRIDLVKNLLPVYLELLGKLAEQHVEWVQFDEPFLAMDLTEKDQAAYRFVYKEIRKQFPSIKILLATYFEEAGDNASLALSLPVSGLHLDLVRRPGQLSNILAHLPVGMHLSLGVVDGRNIWKNDFETSLSLIKASLSIIDSKYLIISPSCSLIHSPCDSDLERNDTILTSEMKDWMAFAKQKLREVVVLKQLSCNE